jgi:chromosome partitioning protein
MHLIVSLLYKGNKVGSIDLDNPQSTLSRYIENRRALNLRRNLDLPIPDHLTISDPASLEADTQRLADTCDYVVIDTSGSNSANSRMVHAWADTLITPINDSFVDLDVLAVVDTETQEILKRGYYAEMVLGARRQKASRTGGATDWIVLRNRLSNLQARNKRCMADTLEKLSTDLDFRNGLAFSDRVIYRELFRSGLTLLDLCEDGVGVSFSMSHIAARQELRALVAAIKPIPAAQAGRADREPRWARKLMRGVEASRVAGGSAGIGDIRLGVAG